jgi:hypothetical protein
MGHLLTCSGLTHPEVSSCETCQWLKCPLNGLWAHSRVSPVVELLPLAKNTCNNILQVFNYNKTTGLYTYIHTHLSVHISWSSVVISYSSSSLISVASHGLSWNPHTCNQQTIKHTFCLKFKRHYLNYICKKVFLLIPVFPKLPAGTDFHKSLMLLISISWSHESTEIRNIFLVNLKAVSSSRVLLTFILLFAPPYCRVTTKSIIPVLMI